LREADKPYLINKLILDASGWRLPAPDRQPLDEPNTHCISKKPRSSGAPSEALPQQSRAVHGAQGRKPVVWHPLAKATTQCPKARLKIDKIMAVKHSDFVARTPPVG